MKHLDDPISVLRDYVGLALANDKPGDAANFESAISILSNWPRIERVIEAARQAYGLYNHSSKGWAELRDSLRGIEGAI